MRLIYIQIIILNIFFISCKSNYSIVEIEKVESANLYNIYIKKDSSIIYVLQERADINFSDKEKLEVGNNYDLKLKKIKPIRLRQGAINGKTNESQKWVLHKEIIEGLKVKTGYYCPTIKGIYIIE